MIVEFTGLPGSGKTTIVNKLIGHLEIKVDIKSGTFDHLSSKGRISLKLIFAFISFFLLPKDSFLIVRELFVNHNRKLESIRDALNILYLMARYHKANKEKESTYIFDQGLVQAFLSSCTYGQWSDRIFEVLKEYPDRIIFVDVSPEVSAKRLSERGDQSSRSQKQTDKIQHLVEQKEILNKILDKLDLPDHKYLTIQVDEEMENQEIDRIKSWLLQ